MKVLPSGAAFLSLLVFGLVPSSAPAGDESTALPASTPDLAALLPRLADDDARRAKLLDDAGYVMTTSVTTLLRGTPREPLEISVRYGRDAGGARVLEVTRAMEGTKDVLARQRAIGALDPRVQEAFRQASVTPFATSLQGLYTFSIQGPDPVDPTKIRIGFAPQGGITSPSHYAGEALVDPAAGTLLRITSQPTAYPKGLKGFKRLRIEAEYAMPTARGPGLSSMKVDGTYARLFSKNRFRATMTFSDYALPESR